MGSKREPSAAMNEMYRRKREDTLARIEAAIRDMKDWGERVTKKRIMEMAGVSSGTLSKPYVLELLKEEGVCQFEIITPSTGSQGTNVKELSAAQTENARLKSRISVLNEQVEKLKSQRDRAADELKALAEENELLRGQRQLLLERMESAGIPMGTIKM